MKNISDKTLSLVLLFGAVASLFLGIVSSVSQLTGIPGGWFELPLFLFNALIAALVLLSFVILAIRYIRSKIRKVVYPGAPKPLLYLFLSFCYFVIIFGYSNNFDSQWSTTCGNIRNVKSVCLYSACFEISSRETENRFARLWEMANGSCADHQWRKFHGYSTNIFGSKIMSGSGKKPIWWSWQWAGYGVGDVLPALYENEPGIAKEFASTLLDLEVDRIVKGKDTANIELDEINLKLIEFTSDFTLNKAQAIQDFKAWWTEYKTTYQ